MDNIPIASLTRDTPPPPSKSIRAIVTLVWPFSSSSRQCAFLLAEPDFRLRYRHGQVRVRFTGPSAEAVAKLHVGIGDEIVVGLLGARWERETGHISTPGKSVDGELVFHGKLDFRIRNPQRDDHIYVDDIDSDANGSGSAKELFATPRPRKALEPGSDAVRSVGPNILYASPAFTKRLRLSGENALDSLYNPFLEHDSLTRKKPRKSFENNRVWRYADRTPSPTPPILSSPNAVGNETAEIDDQEIVDFRVSTPPLRTSDYHDESALVPTSADLNLAGQDDQTIPSGIVDYAQALPASSTSAPEPMLTGHIQIAQAHEDLLISKPSRKLLPASSDQSNMLSPFSIPVQAQTFYPHATHEVLESRNPNIPLSNDELACDTPMIVDPNVEEIQDADRFPSSTAYLPLANPHTLMQDMNTEPCTTDVVPKTDSNIMVASDQDDPLSTNDQSTLRISGTNEASATSLTHAPSQLPPQDVQFAIPDFEDVNSALRNVGDANNISVGVDDGTTWEGKSTSDNVNQVVESTDFLSASQLVNSESVAHGNLSSRLVLEPQLAAVTRSPHQRDTSGTGETPESAKEKVMAQTISSLFGFADDVPVSPSPLGSASFNFETSNTRDDFTAHERSRSPLNSASQVFSYSAHEVLDDLALEHHIETIPGGVVSNDQGATVTGQKSKAPEEIDGTRFENYQQNNDLNLDLRSPPMDNTPANETQDTVGGVSPKVIINEMISDTDETIDDIGEEILPEISNSIPNEAIEATLRDANDIFPHDAGQDINGLEPTLGRPPPTLATSNEDFGVLRVAQFEVLPETSELQESSFTLPKSAAQPLSEFYSPDREPTDQAPGIEMRSTVIHSSTPEIPSSTSENDDSRRVTNLVKVSGETEAGALQRAYQSPVQISNAIGRDETYLDTATNHDGEQAEFRTVGKYNGDQLDNEPGVIRDEEMIDTNFMADVPAIVSAENKDIADFDKATTEMLILDPGSQDADLREHPSAIQLEKLSEWPASLAVDFSTDATHADLPLAEHVLETHSASESNVLLRSEVTTQFGTRVNSGATSSLPNANSASKSAALLPTKPSDSAESPSIQFENTAPSNQTPETMILGRNLPIASRTRSRLSIAEADMIEHSERRISRKPSDDEMIAEQLQTELTAGSGDFAENVATPSRGSRKSIMATDKSPLPIVPESNMEASIKPQDTSRLRSSTRKRTEPMTSLTPKTSTAPSKRPARTPFSSRLSQNPDAINAWFSPKNSTDSPSKSTRSHRRTRSERSNGAIQSDALFAPLKEAFSTPLAYFTPLLRLQKNINPLGTNVHGTNLFDVIAICNGESTGPERAKSGPKDFLTVIQLTDGSLEKNTSISVEVFRPWKAKLPCAAVGDVLLLRAFAIKSRNHQPYLISTDTSAYCVWRFAKGSANLADVQQEATVEVKGPPVELGKEEEQRAKLLRQWWLSTKQTTEQT